MSQAVELASPEALLAEGRAEEALASLPPEGERRAAEWILAGRCLLDRPDPAGALRAYLRADQLAASRHDRWQAALLRARLRMTLGQVLLAAEDCRLALSLVPEQREPRFMLGQALARQGWPDLALRAWSALESPLPGWWAAERQNAFRAMTAARGEVRRGLAARRQGGGDALALAAALLRAGRLRAAEGVVEATSASVEREWLRAMLALRRAEGRPELAQEFERQVPAGAPPPLRRAAAEVLFSLGRVEAAEAALAPLTMEELGVRGRTQLARLLILSGQAGRLEELGRAAVAAAPRHTDAARLLLTARILRRTATLWRGEEEPAPGPVPRWPLVQYWDGPEPPADVAEEMESWRRLNPALPAARFDRASGRAFMAEAAGEAAARTFDAVPHPATRSDLLRLIFLARHGGLYADADLRCLRSFDPLLAATAAGGLGVVASFPFAMPYYVSNDVLIAPPRSPLMAEMVEEVLPRLMAALRRGEEVNTWDMTGPGLLTRIMASTQAPYALMTPAWRRCQAQEVDSLAYKRDPRANWRLAK